MYPNGVDGHISVPDHNCDGAEDDADRGCGGHVEAGDKAEGRADGLAEGRAESRAEGELSKAMAIARNLKSMGIGVADIIKATGLTVDEVAKL